MNDRFDFDGLRVAITGGTSGLGLALVRIFASKGAKVALVARTRDRVEQVAAETGVIGLVADIGNKQDIYPLAMQITGQLGGLDLLVNNASVTGPVPLALLADTECEELEDALAVNLVGPFRLTRALFGALAASGRERGKALVVNISSDAAVEAYPMWGAYGAAKAGLRQLTAIWDAEAHEQGIRFLSVEPGDMDTPLHRAAVPDGDFSALTDPGDAAAAILETVTGVLAERDLAVAS